MAQINPTVGDLKGNSRKIIRYIERAKSLDADLVIFPELAVTGYPPEDLLLKPQFIDDNLTALKEIAKGVTGITAIVGFVDRSAGGLFNGAAVIHRRRVAAVYHKMFLPNYGVFDEKRYFQTGTTPMNMVIHGITIGIGICEDIWQEEGPVRAQALHGAEVIVNINASPYQVGKPPLREEIVKKRARANGVITAYNNMVGGQDELVFDGHGMIVDNNGNVIARGRSFKEELIASDLDVRQPSRQGIQEGTIQAGDRNRYHFGDGKKKEKKTVAEEK